MVLYSEYIKYKQKSTKINLKTLSGMGKENEQILLGGRKMAYKNCLASFTIRKVQIKTMSYHLTPISLDKN